MGLRDFIARRVTRRVDVYRIDDFSVEPPKTVSIIKRVDTVRLKPEIPCEFSRPFEFTEILEKMKAPALNVKLSGKSAKAHNHRIKRFVKEDVKAHRLQLMKKPKTWTLLKQLQALPQERENVLKYMKKRPEALRGEVILACYGPIVEGGVLKLALNKQRGTLLVWYKAGSRQLKAKYAYLIRRLGLGGKPEWRWE